ncbi:MAG: type II toxin-antitoxin system HicB family antitoxin [Albidovulum sp.]|nr:type II toxin-antitoxin system HicB family antitoxin [Albidovulum sp.]
MNRSSDIDKVYRFQVVVEKDGSGNYAHCPGIGAIHVYGENIEEVKAGVNESLLAYLEMSIKHGDPIPQPENVVEPRKFTMTNWTPAMTSKRKKEFSAAACLA